MARLVSGKAVHVANLRTPWHGVVTAAVTPRLPIVRRRGDMMSPSCWRLNQGSVGKAGGGGGVAQAKWHCSLYSTASKACGMLAGRCSYEK